MQKRVPAPQVPAQRVPIQSGLEPRVPAQRVLEHASELLTLEPSLGEGPLGIIRDGAVAIQAGRVVWVGPSDALSAHVALARDGERIDVAGQVVLPGLIDAHTHLVFAGGRELDFEQRIAGATYQEIAASGGGIRRTMRATREATFDELLELGLERLTFMLQHGVTTCEAKSGYGLSMEAELKTLEVMRMLDQSQPVTVVPTFLGAHTVPPEYLADREGYIRLVTDELIPLVARRGLARFCDVFCEQGAYSVEESRRVLEAARAAGLGIKVHAEQLSAFGGARLAADLRAVSADHLEYADSEVLEALRAAGTVAVLLPGAAFFLGQAFPDGRRFEQSGVEIAIASDFNPGSSPTPNLLLVGTMACVRMGMSPASVLRAMTVGAARAIGMQEELGRLAPGMAADLAVFRVTDHRSILYRFGVNLCSMVVKGGEIVLP